MSMGWFFGGGSSNKNKRKKRLLIYGLSGNNCEMPRGTNFAKLYYLICFSFVITIVGFAFFLIQPGWVEKKADFFICGVYLTNDIRMTCHEIFCAT